MLDQALVKSARPRAKAYKMFDERGLFLLVAPTGLKSWRIKYRFDGKERLTVVGRFPEVSLNAARVHRDALRARIDVGDDPASGHQPVTFEQVARQWHAHNVVRWSNEHAEDVMASLERDIFPAIGASPVASLTAPELLACLRGIEARNRRVTAGRIRQRLSAIFGFAMSQDLCPADPAAMLGRAMQGTDLVQPHPALTDIAACRLLIDRCREVANSRMVSAASEFLALTAVRWAAVRWARWDEFEDLGGPNPLWRVPAARMKLAKIKKGESRFDHLVPLSASAVKILCEVQDQNSEISAEDLVFTGRSGRALGEKALSDLYRAAGFAGRHVPHGWRSSFSTLLNETMDEEWRWVIDRALAHAGKDKVEAAYNRSEQLARRRSLFDRWGEMLEGAG